jgi:hypothetical protein
LTLFKELGDFKLPKSEWKTGTQVCIPVDAVFGEDDVDYWTGPVRPVDPGDRDLRDTIRRWCKGEDAEVATDTLKKGFNAAVIAVTEVLSGDQKYTNLINRRSSRRTLEIIEYDARGKKSCEYYIGDEKQGKTGFSLISTDKAKQIQEKVERNKTKYLILTVDDFFCLYKMGNTKSTSIDYKENFQKFMVENGDKIANILNSQYYSIKQNLESELKGSIEAYVLAAYLFVSRMYKSEGFLNKIETVDDVIRISEISRDSLSKHWDPKLKNVLFSAINESNLYDITESIFLSTFSLRGSDKTLNIIDRPLLEKSWNEIHKDPLGVLLKPAEINEQFILVRSGKKFKDLTTAIKKLIKTCEEQDLSPTIEKLKSTYDLLEEISDQKNLKATLESLEERLNEKYAIEKRSINKILMQLKSVDPHQFLPQYKEILSYLSKKKTLLPHEGMIFAACIQSYYTRVNNSDELRLAMELEHLVLSLESKLTESGEYIISELKPKLQEFIVFKEQLV